MATKLVTAPANAPVSLSEGKSHLRVDFTDDDVLIAAMIAASTADAEKFTGRALIDQTWDLFLDAFPCRRSSFFYDPQRMCHPHAIEIPFAPLIEIIGIFYLDADGNEHEIDAASYIVDPVSEPARVFPASAWPTVAANRPNTVRIRFRAGYLDDNSPPADNVPAPIRAAILLHLGDLYANRESMLVAERADVVPLTWGAEALLRPYRVITSIA
jgi:uncharacterized phiE125 gp8 family phage protein